MDQTIIRKDNTFYIGSNHDGEIFFHLDAAGHIVVTHTYVKPEFRGSGYAQRLMEAIINLAEAEHRLIVPVCSYAVRFLNLYTKYKHLLAP